MTVSRRRSFKPEPKVVKTSKAERARRFVKS